MKTKTTIFTRPLIGCKTKDLTWTSALLLIAIIAPALLAHTPQNQWITGTIINATLFLAAWRLGLVNALLIAIIPSTIALMRGLLPAPMALLIPYIIVANALLILTFSFLKNKLIIGIVAASLAKSAFLYLTILFFATKIASPLVMMLSWPQLFTALAGGLLAGLFIASTEKISKSRAL